MIKRRINIRMSGLGGQGVVTSAHVMAMAASKDGIPSLQRTFHLSPLLRCTFDVLSLQTVATVNSTLFFAAHSPPKS